MNFGEPTRIASCFASCNKLLSGDVPTDSKFCHLSIEGAEKARMEDNRFDKLKPIDRNLYDETKNKNYTSAQLEEMYDTLDKLKVYPHNEKSDVVMRPPFLTFKEAFGDNSSVLAEIEKNGFESPSSVQAQMWPTLLDGRDCVGVSQTGSGKTLAFLLPAFLHIDAQYKRYAPHETKPVPSVLVLTPTRELAQQIEREVEKYSYNGYKSVCVYGGGSRNDQIARCKEGVEIIIATPGRLADLSAVGVINLAAVTYVVLDEADRMLDMGFEPSIKRIMFEIRPDRLVALTSATWPEQVRNLAMKYTKDAVMVVVGTLDLKACASVKQYFEFLEEREKLDRICEIVNFLNEKYGRNYKMIVFVKSKVLADHLSSDFCLKGINSQGLHGGRSQTDRENSLAALRTGQVQILIATDLASRGIDIPDITHVCNYDFPGDIEEYVHRVGRTGRAGRNGEAMSFMTYSDRSQAKSLIEILEKSNQEVPQELHRLAQKHAVNVEKYGERPKRSFRGRKDDNSFQSSY